MPADLPPHLRSTGRQTEAKLIDPPCPHHGAEHARRGWVPCATPSLAGHDRGWHNRWMFDCGTDVYLVGEAYETTLECERVERMPDL